VHDLVLHGTRSAAPTSPSEKRPPHRSEDQCRDDQPHDHDVGVRADLLNPKADGSLDKEVRLDDGMYLIVDRTVTTPVGHAESNLDRVRLAVKPVEADYVSSDGLVRRQPHEEVDPKQPALVRLRSGAEGGAGV
jgi:hypothetical protein